MCGRQTRAPLVLIPSQLISRRHTHVVWELSASPSRRRRRISLLHIGAGPPHLLPHGSRRYSAALPPSRCSWLRALGLPSAPSLPLAAALSDPHLDQPPPPPHMTQAALDLVGGSEEVAARPLPIVFLCFWLGVGDALLPASALSPSDAQATP